MPHSLCQQIWKIRQWPQDWKKSIFNCIPIPKKGNAKNVQNYHTVAPISHAIKVMQKIPQIRFQQYTNWELADVEAGLRKSRASREETIHKHNMKRRNTRHYRIRNANIIGIAIAHKPIELGVLLPGSECCPYLFITLLPHPQPWYSHSHLSVICAGVTCNSEVMPELRGGS